MNRQTMVTYSTREAADVEVSTTMMTMRTERKPSDTARLVSLAPEYIGGRDVFEVHVGDRYYIAVAGEVVHESEHALDDRRPALHVTELPDGSRHVWTTDGLFAAWIGSRGRGLRVTLRDDAEWSRFDRVMSSDRVGWAIGSAVFHRRDVLRVASR